MYKGHPKKVAQLRRKETKETKKTVWENVIVISIVEIITEALSNGLIQDNLCVSWENMLNN